MYCECGCGHGHHGHHHHEGNHRPFMELPLMESQPLMPDEDKVKTLEEMKETLENRLNEVNKRLEDLKH